MVKGDGSGVVTVGVANVLGPQAFVADRNLERALDPSRIPPGGRTGLDEVYIGRLGVDAIPAIVAVLPRLPADDRAWLEPLLEQRRFELTGDRRYQGWPAWNLSRERAREALAPDG